MTSFLGLIIVVLLFVSSMFNYVLSRVELVLSHVDILCHWNCRAALHIH